MEKKTIGGFIAALRKANGMAQKELRVFSTVEYFFNFDIRKRVIIN